jgi:hypothetical protein
MPLQTFGRLLGQKGRANYMSAMDSEDSLDGVLETMVRDFCMVGPKPKSQVRGRITEFACAAIKEARRVDNADGKTVELQITTAVQLSVEDYNHLLANQRPAIDEKYSRIQCLKCGGELRFNCHVDCCLKDDFDGTSSWGVSCANCGYQYELGKYNAILEGKGERDG